MQAIVDGLGMEHRLYKRFAVSHGQFELPVLLDRTPGRPCTLVKTKSVIVRP